jgi:hypothetical protein
MTVVVSPSIRCLPLFVGSADDSSPVESTNVSYRAKDSRKNRDYLRSHYDEDLNRRIVVEASLAVRKFDKGTHVTHTDRNAISRLFGRVQRVTAAIGDPTATAFRNWQGVVV